MTVEEIFEKAQENSRKLYEYGLHIQVRRNRAHQDKWCEVRLDRSRKWDPVLSTWMDTNALPETVDMVWEEVLPFLAGVLWTAHQLNKGEKPA